MKPAFYLLISLLLTLRSAIPAQAQFPDPATTRYVRTSGSNSDPASATSWATATSDLQGAINSLSVTGGQVWVAAGTHYPSRDEAGNSSPSDARTKTFLIQNGVALYGGFPAIGDPVLSQRSPAANPTILSGDLDQNNTLDANNAYNVVVFGTATTSSTRLDGFTVTGSFEKSGVSVRGAPVIANCLITSNQAATGGGGGLNIDNGASLTLINSQIVSNTITAGPGGGIYLFNSSLIAVNCRFAGNKSLNFGGGIESGYSSCTLINCSFSGNESQYGAGMDLDHTPAQLINCSISGNRAIGDGNGGGIFSYLSPGILLQNSIVWGNDAVTKNPEFENTSEFTLVNTLVKGVNPGGTNLDGVNPANDPLFIAQPTPGVTTSGDLQLRPCSPAINAGSPATTTTVTGATDLAGQPRIFGTRIDLGAYEFQSAPVSLSLALSAPAGTTLSCLAPALPVNAVATGGTNVTYTFTGSGLSGIPSTSSSATVSTAGTFTVAAQNAEGCVVSGTLTVTGSSTPVGAVTISSLTGILGCGSNQVTFTASSAGAVQYVLMPGNVSAPSGSFTVTTAGAYTVTATNGLSGCAQSSTVSVTAGNNAVAGPVSASGQLSGGNPVRLSASGTGSLFVFTGPGGFVFSTVYRAVGSYGVSADGIVLPGVYTLTIYGTEGCPPAVSRVTVN